MVENCGQDSQPNVFYMHRIHGQLCVVSIGNALHFLYPHTQIN